MVKTIARVSLLMTLFIILLIYCNYVPIHFVNISHENRILSATVDLITGENVKTINGTVPEVSCPLGHYRPSGSTIQHRVSGQRQDGCRQCPKGRYGDKIGLKSPKCSGSCPVGTYGDKFGLLHKNDCKMCPAGTYGANVGLTTNKCTASCPVGKYSDTEGNTALNSCKLCPNGYYEWQCKRP